MAKEHPGAFARPRIPAQCQAAGTPDLQSRRRSISLAATIGSAADLNAPLRNDLDRAALVLAAAVRCPGARALQGTQPSGASSPRAGRPLRSRDQRAAAARSLCYERTRNRADSRVTAFAQEQASGPRRGDLWFATCADVDSWPFYRPVCRVVARVPIARLRPRVHRDQASFQKAQSVSQELNSSVARIRAA